MSAAPEVDPALTTVLPDHCPLVELPLSDLPVDLGPYAGHLVVVRTFTQDYRSGIPPEGAPFDTPALQLVHVEQAAAAAIHRRRQARKLNRRLVGQEAVQVPAQIGTLHLPDEEVVPQANVHVLRDGKPPLIVGRRIRLTCRHVSVVSEGGNVTYPELRVPALARMWLLPTQNQVN